MLSGLTDTLKKSSEGVPIVLCPRFSELVSVSGSECYGGWICGAVDGL